MIQHNQGGSDTARVRGKRELSNNHYNHPICHLASNYIVLLMKLPIEILEYKNIINWISNKATILYHLVPVMRFPLNYHFQLTVSDCLLVLTFIRECHFIIWRDSVIEKKKLSFQH